MNTINWDIRHHTDVSEPALAMQNGYIITVSVIYIFDGAYKADDALKGPLGKKPLTPLRGAGNYDPTDPAV